MNFNLLSSVYLADTFEPIAKWVTIGFVSALALVILVTLFVDKASVGKVAKNSLIALVFYALIMGIFLLVLEIIKKYDPEYLESKWVNAQITTHVFLPVLVTLIVALIGGITLFILSKKKPSAFKITALIVGIAIAVGIVVSLVLIAIYYSNNIVLKDKQERNRLLIQYSENFGKADCVNIFHRFLTIKKH